MADWFRPTWVRILLLAAAYFGAAELGLTMAFVQQNVTPVWPPIGIALAALLLWGYRVWPGIFLGAFLVNALTVAGPVTALMMACGNSLAALAGAWAVHRFIGRDRWLDRPTDVVTFILLAGFAATTISATIGVAGLHLAGLAPWPLVGTLWLTWWLGDTAGVVIYAPLLLAWSQGVHLVWSARRWWEWGLLVALVIATTLIAFGPHPFSHYPLAYLPIPLLLWAIFHFERLGATTAIFLVTAIANWGTVRGYGSFIADSPNESLILLQLFIGVVTLSTLVLGAVLIERTQAQSELRRNVALLKAQQEGTTEGILVVDDQHGVVAFNPRFQEMWRIPPEIMASRDDDQLLAHVRPQVVDWEGFRQRISELYGHPQQTGFEEIRLTDGRAFERYSTPAQAQDGTYYGRIWYFKDVTERERMEAALREQNEELKKLDALKNNFVNVVSHELRTPLTSLVGYAEFLEDEVAGPLTPQQAEFVQEIQDNGRRLTLLVNDLLDFSRLQTGTLALSFQEADLAPIARRVMASLRPQADRAGLNLKIEAPAEPVPVWMDPERIGQVLLNLVDNAIKFTPREGHITLRISPTPEDVRIEVQDTGVGIAADNIPRLFERFYQVDGTTTRTRGGVGLGLAIAKAIVDQHGGQIGVESQLGRGTTFWVCLPVAARTPMVADQAVET